MIRQVGFLVLFFLLTLGGLSPSWAGVRWVRADVAGMA